MKLYLVRHGESEGNVKRLLYGQTDCPLTPDGMEQARAVAEKLRETEIKGCYSSPLCRAAETARACAEPHGLPVTLMDGLMEQHMGDYEEVSFDQMAQTHPEVISAILENWTEFVPPNGESYPQVSERALRCLDEILAKEEDALVVAHNGSLSAIFSSLLGASCGGVGKFLFMHGCYSCVEITSRGTRLMYFNK